MKCPLASSGRCVESVVGFTHGSWIANTACLRICWPLSSVANARSREFPTLNWRIESVRGSGAGVAGGEVGGEEAEELEEAGIWEGGREGERAGIVGLLAVGG